MGLGLVRRLTAGVTLPLGVAAVGFVLRLRTALAEFETMDERLWTHRSAAFWDSLADGHLRSMSSSPDGDLATMPGVTTMWLGAAARGVWAFVNGLNWWPESRADTVESAQRFQSAHCALDVAQVVMALALSVLLGVVVVLLRRWLGGTAAAVTGVLLATEPFLVAHGAVLHTDELLWMFGLAAVIATALALGVPFETPWAGRRQSAILAGGLFAGALLTKITALTLVPGLVALVGWAALRAVRGRAPDERRAALAPLVRLTGVALAAVAVLVVVLYPALWARPLTELEYIRNSARMGSRGHYQYFLGEPTTTPGPAYYLVAMPFRTTPWLLVLGVVSACVAWLNASTRAVAGVLGLVALAPFVALSLASKQLERYGMVFLMLAAVLVGWVTSVVVDRLRETGKDDLAARIRPAGALAAAVVALHSFVVAPWGLAYFNPMLGGSAVAPEVVAVGWGEGTEQAGDAIAQLVDGDCDDVTVDGYLYFLAQFRCGEPPEDGEPADYVVISITSRQTVPFLQPDLTGRDLVAETTIRGITYLEIYGPPDSNPP